MQGFIHDYADAIYKNQDRFIPMVPLGNVVKLGDLLLLRKDGRRGIEYMGNLGDAAIGIDVEEGADESASDQNWQSSSGMTWSFKAAGTAPKIGSVLAESEAGLSISLSKEKAFLFQPRGIKYNRIDNLVSVRSALVNKLTRGQFDSRELWVVKQVASVQSYALAISISKQGSLEVSARTGVSSLSLQDLARVDLGLSIKRADDLGFSEVGAEGGSLFFRAEKIVLKRELPADTRLLLANTPSLRAGGALLDLPHSVLRTRPIKTALTFRDMTFEDFTTVLEE